MILVAPDSYKGTLTAAEAAAAIAEGFDLGWPGIECVVLPLGDGGEGTVSALAAAVGGVYRAADVSDPLGRPVEAAYCLLRDGTALLEMAAASGLILLRDGELDVFRASTFGTGQLLETARSCSRKLVLGIGGSATAEGGLGMARALGVRFLDERGDEVTRPAELERITDIDAGGLSPDWADVTLRVMCDVDNPLNGPWGAARVFGPQKGASPEQVRVLEAGLAHLGRLLEKFSGERVVDCPGAGAAGGLGAMLRGLLGAELLPGAEVALDVAGFDRVVEGGCELVVTGEGRLDRQTLSGKLPLAVSRRARKRAVPVVAIPGAVETGIEGTLRLEFDALIPVQSSEAEVDASRAADLLRATSARAAACLRVGRSVRGSEMH
ncbi:MAG: glycerate kinase [Bacillota bacterium]